MHRFVRVILCKGHANLMPAHVSWVSMASTGFFIYIYIFAMYPNFPNIETLGALYPSTAVMKTRFVTEAAG